MTARIAEDAQGELQGAIASVVSFTSIIGPPIMTGIFGAYADKQGIFFPGAPYMLSTVLIIVAALVLGWTLKRYADE
jgi:MFS transporter, DHA1 family, tetracycline resistance protein